MEKIQTINEINRLHNEWIPKNFNKGMGINYETLKFYSWLKVSQPSFFIMTHLSLKIPIN